MAPVRRICLQTVGLPPPAARPVVSSSRQPQGSFLFVAMHAPLDDYYCQTVYVHDRWGQSWTIYPPRQLLHDQQWRSPPQSPEGRRMYPGWLRVTVTHCYQDDVERIAVIEVPSYHQQIKLEVEYARIVTKGEDRE
jgi:hypothetical protein